MDVDYLGGCRKYRQERVLGFGAFGVVIEATELEKQERVAIKLFARGGNLRSYKSYVVREIENQVQLVHPLVVEVKEVFITPRYLAIAMEYVSGGDLYSYISRHTKTGCLPEDHAKGLFQQLILGLDFCHSKGISSRDLKLENLLLDGDGLDGTKPLLKICDFGFSKNESISPARSNVGTPIYMAPELILGEPYDGKQADIWSCGVVLFTIIFGSYPFDEREKDFHGKLTRAEYTIPEDPKISDSCRDLIQMMLVADPRQRFTMEDVKRHGFFCDGLPDGALAMNAHFLRNKRFSNREWPLYKDYIKAIVNIATSKWPGQAEWRAAAGLQNLHL